MGRNRLSTRTIMYQRVWTNTVLALENRGQGTAKVMLQRPTDPAMPTIRATLQMTMDITRAATTNVTMTTV